jgi:hypothetical protein
MCCACTVQEVDLLASPQDAHDAEVQGHAARPPSSDYTVRAGTGLVAALEARGERAVEECGQLIDAIVHAGHGEGGKTGVVYVSGRELSCMPVPLSANARAVRGCAERGGVSAGVLKGWLKGAGDKGKAREDEDGDSAPTEESWQITQVGCGGVMAEKREWRCDAASVLLLRKSTRAHTHAHARACMCALDAHAWMEERLCVCLCLCLCLYFCVWHALAGTDRRPERLSEWIARGATRQNWRPRTLCLVTGDFVCVCVQAPAPAHAQTGASSAVSIIPAPCVFVRV